VLLTEGWRRAEERALERLAWSTACLMNAWGAKVTVNDLLGRVELSVEEKMEAVLRAQYEREGKDPRTIPHVGPSEKLERLMGGGAWPQSAN
jgi:hypothetical protein